MRLRVLALVLLVPLAAACLDPIEAPNGRFGSVTLNTYDGGPGVYVMRPEAGFYGQTDLRYDAYEGDTCLLASYSDSILGVLPRTLDAGEFLVSSIGGRTDTMTYVPTASNFTLYRSTATGGFAFTPGDTFSIVIPGTPSGFPASAGRVRTAEPFTHSAIGVPVDNDPIQVTWTPAPAPGSYMTFSLRYANSFSTGNLNEQVYCSFVDDGAGTIPANRLAGWVNSINNARSVQARRIRATILQVDGRTQLGIISYFGQPLLGSVTVE